MYKDFSERYYSTIEEYVDFHENGTEKFSGEETFVGSSLIRWVFHINNIIKATQSTSQLILDVAKQWVIIIKLSADEIIYEMYKIFGKLMMFIFMIQQ